jgi:hypothetical protein
MDTPRTAIERTWYAVAPNGLGEGLVTIGVEVPRQQSSGDWGVRVSLGGLEPDPAGPIFGIDGWQAVSLGMKFVAARLVDFADRGWRFYWSQDGELADLESLRDG